MDNLLKTPLYELHKMQGARIIDFAGWALPVQFSGIIEEHLMVRTGAGLFDVSHMGEIVVTGKGAVRLLDYLLANEISSLENGIIRYSHICNPNGGVVDDILVYRLGIEEFLLVVNASNIGKDLSWIKSYAYGDVEVEDVSGTTAQLAVQGPFAEGVIQKLISDKIAGMKYYSFQRDVHIGRHRCILSRTGYTGEDGFEIYCSQDEASDLWNLLMDAGEEYNLRPAGLGARDTLRFEACLPLYGHELSEDITPLEAGLGRFVKMDKRDFIGRAALKKQAEEGLKRRLAGLEMMDRGIPRTEYGVFHKGSPVGFVTTGSYCPALQKNLALAIIDINSSEIGQVVEVDIRGRKLEAKVVDTPFYRRSVKT